MLQHAPKLPGVGIEPDWGAWRVAFTEAGLGDTPIADRCDPLSRPVTQVGPLLSLLHRAELNFVVAGSCVLIAHGAALVPGDLDIVPATDRANLARLGAACEAIRAVPLAEPSWEHGLSVDEARRWVPDPDAPESFDTQLVTELGVLDVVPSLCGTYEELAAEAVVAPDGVRYAPVGPIVERMRQGSRRKDLERTGAFQRIAPGPRALTQQRRG